MDYLLQQLAAEARCHQILDLAHNHGSPKGLGRAHLSHQAGVLVVIKKAQKQTNLNYHLLKTMGA